MLAAAAMLFLNAGPMDRPTFARNLAKVQPAMTKAQVRALLGKPDDIITEADPPPHSDWNGGEIWNYGTDRHLGFPTVGSVTFTRRGLPIEWHGTTGKYNGQLPESHLRTLLRLLADSGPLAHDDRMYAQTDPLTAIRMALALQPLGKAEILEVMREFCDVAEYKAAYYYPPHATLLGMLFQVDPAKLPLERGEWDLRTATTIVDGMPLPWHYSPFGRPPTVAPYLPLCRRAGILKRQWTPPQDPVSLPERIWATGVLKDRKELEPIYKSVRLLLRTCIPLIEEEVLGRTMDAKAWHAFAANFKNRKVVWNAGAQCYTFEGAPPVTDRRFMERSRMLWQPRELAQFDFRVAIDTDLLGQTGITEIRSPADTVDVTVSVEQTAPERKVFKLGRHPREVGPDQFSITSGYSGPDAKGTTWEYVRVGAVRFRLVVQTGDWKIVSPEFKLPGK